MQAVQVGEKVRILAIILACLLAAAGSFWVTARLIEPHSAGSVAALGSGVEIEMKAGALTPIKGAELAPHAHGLLLASRFVSRPDGAIEGAAYTNFSGNRIVARPDRRLRIEVEATRMTADQDAQSLELLYVQNGLASSPWLKLALTPDRNIYTAHYSAPAEKRGSDRIDTLWIRSDAAGSGRPIILHAIRLAVD